MNKENTQFVGITMPDWLAKEFLEESENRFGDCRWLTLLFYKELYKLMWEKSEPDKLIYIENMRIDLLNKMEQLYKRKR